MLVSTEILAGKVALIAGVGTGMGGATARLLAEMGADIAAIDISPEASRRALDDVAALGRQAHLELVDLRDAAAVKGAVDAIVAAMGRLDILVTVAGGFTMFQQWQPFDQTTMAEWDEMMERNLRYVANLSLIALPHIVRHSGCVVYVSSISGTTSAPNHASYGAAKAGLANFTRSMAIEYGKRGVRVNTVAPGSIATDAVRNRLEEEEIKASFAAVPLSRPGLPEEIAGAVGFLVSPFASYVTGHTLVVDGGVSINFPFPV
jgi:NAD(P)-dependent dehydrogenase (short-subunit alcohol dehydrogenase family)